MSFQQVDFAQYWNTLQETVKNILSLNTVTMEAWNKSFNDVFILSISYPSSNSKKLYESTKLLLEEHVLELLHIVQTENGWNLLQMYYMYWQQYSQCIKHLNSLYRYFNTHNMQRHGWNGNELMYRNIGLTDTIYMEIKELGLDVWKCNMILPLKDSISKLILVEIDKKKHRISKTTSLNTITGVINSFIEVQKSGRNQLELYQSYLEQPFLEQSKKHIKLEAARLLQEFTVSEYLVKVLQYMKDEDFRSKRYLPDSTYNTIQLMCYQHFVIDHFNLIREDSVAIIKEEQFYDMRNIYVLLNKANYGLNEIADIFRQHLEQDGMTVIESLKQKQVYLHFIEALIDFHKKNESIVLDVFNNNILFIEALNKAFTTIVNYQIVENQRSKSPEYLSNYCDMLLKKSYKSINEVEFENKLLHCIAIFKCLNDKDIFKNMYQKQLAIRLMLQQSQSTDVEKRMIIKLQEVNGYKFTSNLHKMLIDIRVSKGLNAQFHNEFLEAASDKLNVSFSTYVLRSDVWPLNSSTTSFVLPKQLISCTQHFEVFYKEKFNGKTLTWIHHMSRGQLILNYLQKTYTVKLNTLQMSILLLFEDYDTLKYSDIYDLLQINNNELRKHIDSLVNCKLLLLDDDIIKLNMVFSNKHTTFHVNLNIQKDTQQEIEQNVKTTKDDHKLQLQATIIRIMKVRNTLRHKLLVNEIFSQSNLFFSTNALIKISIEELIDKGYLERNENVNDEYNYVA